MAFLLCPRLEVFSGGAAGPGKTEGLLMSALQYVADYQHRHEAILYGWIEDGPHYFVPDRTQRSVFDFDKPSSSSLHPTTKPTALIADMIQNSSRPNEIIYDPFCGSGSTIIAAAQLKRIGYGCELDPGYVAVELERLTSLG